MSDSNALLLEGPSFSSSAEAHRTEFHRPRSRRRRATSARLSSVGTPLLLLLLCFQLILAAAGLDRQKSLYKETDPILELDVATFNSSIYNKPTAFIVEFYSSWCGHCIDYAPHYVEFAKLLKPWSSVVVVAALNCADELNAPVCRSHGIDAFPMLKYFKLWSKDKSQSDKFTGSKKNLVELSLFVADWLKRDYDAAESRPVTWPRYDITPAQTSLSDLWTNVADPMASLLCVVVENSPASNGFALITNYAAEKRVYVTVVEPSHPISQRFGGLEVPAIHIFRRKNPEEVVYSSNSDVTWRAMKEQIDELLISEPSLNQQQIPQPTLNTNNVPVKGDIPPADHQPSKAAKWNQFEVQLLDIQSALRYMLTQEIPRRPLIAGAELSALSVWIRMLRNYVPGPAPLRRLFYRLDEWLVKRAAGGGPIKADDWLLAVESTQSELGRPLPSNTSFMACRGSQPYLRGYTCGLWTLFHAVTVQAYKQEKDNVHFKPHIDVLDPIHQFVVQFLSCEVCAKNFNKMAAERAIQEAKRPEDVVLWLWRAHNAVNRRLSGEKSDDPLFPKQQFPSVELCGDCALLESGELDFDESKSLQFLIKYYSDIKMDGVQIAADYQMKEFAHGQLKKVADRQLNPKFAGMAGKVDNLEELEARLNNVYMDSSGPKRQWKTLSGFDGPIDASAQGADRTTFYLIWLVIVALILGFVYMKYRQNRSKFWKTFYYYNDYKLLPWRQRGLAYPLSGSSRTSYKYDA